MFLVASTVLLATTARLSVKALLIPLTLAMLATSVLAAPPFLPQLMVSPAISAPSDLTAQMQLVLLSVALSVLSTTELDLELNLSASLALLVSSVQQ